MIALMPLRDGDLIHAEVLAGLVSQTVPMTLLAISRPGGTRATEAATRNLLRLVALGAHPGEEAFLLLDSDTVLGDPGLVSAMHAKMYAGEYGAMAANVKPKSKFEREEAEHVDLGCCLVRAEVLRTIPFRTAEGSCCCMPFTADVRAAGWKIAYLSLDPAGHQIARL